MRVSLGLIAAICLCAAAPPGWFPGAGLLVVPGWMAFYAALSGEALSGEKVRFAKWQAYLVGLAYMLTFSFSVRHVLLPAYIGIGLVGGLYFVLAVVWTRAVARVLPGAVAFGLALAGVHWLRAHFTEIQYPHGQPVHALYEWPSLLGSLGWGSEVWGNLLLGVLAGGLVDLYRSWRVAQPGFRTSLGVVFASALLLVVPGWVRGATSTPDSVRIAALEPGFGFEDFRTSNFVRLMEPRIFTPTAAKVKADPSIELLVWPESMSCYWLSGYLRPALRLDQRLRSEPLRFAGQARLLSGVHYVAQDAPGGRQQRVAVAMTDGRGRLLGHHEKRRLVPGGEHQPFLDWLPKSWSDWTRKLFENVLGGAPLPDITPGDARPPLKTPSGVPFGTLTCFDNAFPEVAEEQVAAGARFLVVVSNEAWYRGGAELDQMIAMTVCRSIECRVPILRCTVDGATLAVSPDGRVVGALPHAEPGQSRFFCHDLAIPKAGVPAVPPLHSWIRWLVLLSSLMMISTLYRCWGRLLRRRSASGAPADR